MSIAPKLVLGVSLILAVPTWHSCSGPGSSQASVQSRRSRGSVLSYPPAMVWSHAFHIMNARASELQTLSDGQACRGQVSGGQVDLSVEPYDSAGQKAILRVTAERGGREDASLAEDILLQIQQSLLSESMHRR